jgi:hypothetical protein
MITFGQRLPLPICRDGTIDDPQACDGYEELQRRYDGRTNMVQIQPVRCFAPDCALPLKPLPMGEPYWIGASFLLEYLYRQAVKAQLGWSTN